jgi:hypothetical protein
MVAMPVFVFNEVTVIVTPVVASVNDPPFERVLTKCELTWKRVECVAW